MIKLSKKEKPQILKDDGLRWTRNLMWHKLSKTEASDTLKGRYRHDDIKLQVTLETNGKCMYCESYVTHQYPGDVEHIIPKSVYPILTFLWSNLSFACYWCNNSKNDAFDKDCRLLNPYKDAINDHLRAFGPIVLHINGSKRGELTHLTIKLNRNVLIERRKDALNNFQNLIDKFERETVQSLKFILHQEIIDSIGDDKEFSFYLKQFLNDRGGVVI